MKKILVLAFLMLSAAMMTPSIGGAAPVPDTDQTTSYTDTFGEDSDYNINPPSYTKLSIGGEALPYTAAEWAMVQDNVTGLVWEVKTPESDSSIHSNKNRYLWNLVDGFFVSLLNGLPFGGQADWRLPTVKELTSIVARDASNPAVNEAFFPQTVASSYWTSTSLEGQGTSAWSVNFSTGSIEPRDKSQQYYVRVVRGEWEDPRVFIDNGDGTITDSSSGLMWQQQGTGDQTPATTKNWEDALTYAEGLDLAGYDDWRLPNINELQSIIDYGENNPAVDTDFFPLEPDNDHWHWSSTTQLSSGGAATSAWRLSLGTGSSTPRVKTNSYYVRAVRGGQNRLPGRLIIKSPMQVSSWLTGRAMTITWDTPPEIAANVKILVSHDGGKNFDTVVAESTENDGHHEWTVTGPDSFNSVLKIEPIDEPSKGTTQGLFRIWTNLLPSEPSAPLPPDQAVDENETIQLSWGASEDPEGDTVTYDVYLGTSSTLTDPAAAALTATTYDPGTLKCNETYSWKIAACDSYDDCAEGPVWGFSTIVVAGDLNGDCHADLRDAVLAFQIVCGLAPGEPPVSGADVNGDGKVGLAEALYVLQTVSSLRSP